METLYAEICALEQRMERELDAEKCQQLYWRARALREQLDPPSGLVIDRSI